MKRPPPEQSPAGAVAGPTTRPIWSPLTNRSVRSTPPDSSQNMEPAPSRTIDSRPAISAPSLPGSPLAFCWSWWSGCLRLMRCGPDAVLPTTRKQRPRSARWTRPRAMLMRSARKSAARPPCCDLSGSGDVENDVKRVGHEPENAQKIDREHLPTQGDIVAAALNGCVDKAPDQEGPGGDDVLDRHR